jgi:hypothetical protein
VIVPRLPGRLYGAASPFAGPAHWHDTAVGLDAIPSNRQWRDALTGAAVRATRRNDVRLDTVLRLFPLAVLVPEGICGCLARSIRRSTTVALLTVSEALAAGRCVPDTGRSRVRRTARRRPGVG